MSPRITDDDIEAHAWGLVRANQAPTFWALREWAQGETYRRDNPPQAANSLMMSVTRRDIGGSYDKAIVSVLWKLMRAGVLVPGPSSQGQSLSWDSTQLTEHAGAAADVLPSDPHYVAQLEALRLDPLALRYVRESIRCLSANALAASIVMLGVASEIVIDQLMLAFAKSVEGNDKLVVELDTKPTAKQRYEAFKKQFESKARRLLEESGQPDSSHFIDGIFNIIRLARNDAGHPSGRDFTHAEAQANLLMFREFVRLCLPFAEWLERKARPPGP